MLILQDISYIHPNRDLLFKNINLNINKQNKVALIGNNGIGKSTLLKMIAGDLIPASGTVYTTAKPYYIPQIYGQFNEYNIAQSLNIEDKLNALQEILAGNVNEANLTALNDDWTIEERCQEAVAHWKLKGLDLNQKMETLSGGEKTKVFLAGIAIHQPDIILMDEPSNHLDMQSRQILYDFIETTPNTLVVVSHDRKLLNMLDSVYEMNKQGMTFYGGNYDFYAAQKLIETNALDQHLKNKEKTLRKAKETGRETLERQQKLDARGKKKQEKAGLPTISMNTFKNNAEKSTSRVKGIHAEKVGSISQELQEIRRALPDTDKIKLGFDNSALHTGKILLTAENINHSYGEHLLWKQSLHFQITSGERIALKGLNGAGKTTLIKIIIGEIVPAFGTIHSTNINAVYIDQDYSLVDDQISVYDQAQKFNHSSLQEHEIKIRLNRFLFTKEYWEKPCSTLSGGEKMRLMLCCLTISNKAPDMIILDEPTNNLDIQNIEILTVAINEYEGTLIIISHDEYFLGQILVQQTIYLA